MCNLPILFQINATVTSDRISPPVNVSFMKYYELPVNRAQCGEWREGVVCEESLLSRDWSSARQYEYCIAIGACWYYFYSLVTGACHKYATLCLASRSSV